MEKIDKLSKEEATKWLAPLAKSKWALSFDENSRRWGEITSNNAEIMNFVFKGIRKLPVTAIVMTTFYKLNSYHVKYLENVTNTQNRWLDGGLMKKLEKMVNKAASHTVICYNFNRGIYQIQTIPRRTLVVSEEEERFGK